MTSRRSSGSSREDNGVEPTRSQNMTVSCRRSAPSMRADAATVDGAEAAPPPTGLPQPPQNFAVVSFSNPQTGQGEGSGAPHSAQKRLVAAFFGHAAQAAHRVSPGVREVSSSSI